MYILKLRDKYINFLYILSNCIAFYRFMWYIYGIAAFFNILHHICKKVSCKNMEFTRRKRKEYDVIA